MTTNSVLEGPLQTLARSAWQTVLVTGILSVILGVLILLWPGVSILTAGIIFGIYLLVSGILQLGAAFAVPASAGMRILYFITGLLSIVLGVFCFRDWADAVFLLGIWIGIGWLFRGITVATAAFSEPALPARGWQGFFGVITAIAGVVLIVWPDISIATLALVAGIWLVILGVMEVIMAFGVKKDAEAAAH